MPTSRQQRAQALGAARDEVLQTDDLILSVLSNIDCTLSLRRARSTCRLWCELLSRGDSKPIWRRAWLTVPVRNDKGTISLTVEHALRRAPAGERIRIAAGTQLRGQLIIAHAVHVYAEVGVHLAGQLVLGDASGSMCGLPRSLVAIVGNPLKPASEELGLVEGLRASHYNDEAVVVDGGAWRLTSCSIISSRKVRACTAVRVRTGGALGLVGCTVSDAAKAVTLDDQMCALQVADCSFANLKEGLHTCGGGTVDVVRSHFDQVDVALKIDSLVRGRAQDNAFGEATSVFGRWARPRHFQLLANVYSSSEQQAEAAEAGPDDSEDEEEAGGQAGLAAEHGADQGNQHAPARDSDSDRDGRVEAAAESPASLHASMHASMHASDVPAQGETESPLGEETEEGTSALDLPPAAEEGASSASASSASSASQPVAPETDKVGSLLSAASVLWSTLQGLVDDDMPSGEVMSEEASSSAANLALPPLSHVCPWPLCGKTFPARRNLARHHRNAHHTPIGIWSGTTDGAHLPDGAPIAHARRQHSTTPAAATSSSSSSSCGGDGKGSSPQHEESACVSGPCSEAPRADGVSVATGEADGAQHVATHAPPPPPPPPDLYDSARSKHVSSGDRTAHKSSGGGGGGSGGCGGSSPSTASAADSSAHSVSGGDAGPSGTPGRKGVDALWVQCDACLKWRRLPTWLDGEPSLYEAWTCESGAARWSLQLSCADGEDPSALDAPSPKDAVTTQGTPGASRKRRGRVETWIASTASVKDERGMEREPCGTPGCTRHAWHSGPCSEHLPSTPSKCRSRKPSMKIFEQALW